MGRDLKAADERDACSKEGVVNLPVNPYPAPGLLHEDRPGYPFAARLTPRTVARMDLYRKRVRP